MDTRTEYVALTVKEFCERHRMSPRKLYYELKAGRLRAVKRGRQTLILKTEEERYLASLPAYGSAA